MTRGLGSSLHTGGVTRPGLPSLRSRPWRPSEVVPQGEVGLRQAGRTGPLGLPGLRPGPGSQRASESYSFSSSDPPAPARPASCLELLADLLPPAPQQAAVTSQFIASVSPSELMRPPGPPQPCLPEVPPNRVSFPNEPFLLVWAKGLLSHQTPTRPVPCYLGGTHSPWAPGIEAINVAGGFADIPRSLLLCCGFT